MPDRPHLRISHLRVRSTRARLGDDLFIDGEQSVIDAEGFKEEVARSIPKCASCAAIIHDPKEAGGACTECHFIVCTPCSAHRCAIDNKILCHDHVTTVRGQPICRSHRLGDVLGLLIRAPTTK